MAPSFNQKLLIELTTNWGLQAEKNAQITSTLAEELQALFRSVQHIADFQLATFLRKCLFTYRLFRVVADCVSCSKNQLPRTLLCDVNETDQGEMESQLWFTWSWGFNSCSAVQRAQRQGQVLAESESYRLGGIDSGVESVSIEMKSLRLFAIEGPAWGQNDSRVELGILRLLK